MKTTSSALVSSSSVCSSCKSCNLKTVSIDVDEDTLGDLSGNIPVIIPGGTTPAGITATITPRSSPSTTSTEPLQSANPIDFPSCAWGGIDPKDIIPETLDGTNGSLQDLLFKLREEACSRTCSTAGPDIPGKAVSTLNDNGQCEIRVAITGNIEAYLYRATPARGDQQQQCWDSFEAILNKCVNNGPNKGWWNGNHVSQFYEAGVRPLNDGTAKNNFKLTEWLGASTVGLTCAKDCVGFIPNPDWCNKNCFHQKRQVEPSSTSFTSRRNRAPILRSRATDNKKVNCGITYTLPDYPSTAKEDKPRNDDAGSITEITNNGWWDYTDNLFVPAPDVCFRKLRKTSGRSPGKEYATEHIYEKHIVKMYINWLSYDMTEDNGGFEAGKVATCDTMKNVFNTKSNDPNSKFKDIKPAQALANTMSCSGTGCPATDRLSEFYILAADVNSLKENVLGEMRKDADFKYLSCNYADWRNNLAKLGLMSAVFQYLSEPKVAEVWVKVHNRMRGVLADLDADASYANYRPSPLKVPGNLQIVHNGWLGAYDYFMRMFLEAAQEKTRQYAFGCVDTISAQIDEDGTLTDAAAKKALKEALLSHRTAGMWSDNVLKFGDGYKNLMGSEWS
ncbi:hypothetical protein DE146DRAFT_704047 [Phaeosphaeria sp. MPI-PUGE-AT-0046c]|nr:hypothetical protein DE146DRAFT_704047 [Phaeosphaeria sp. MPI-PUGE-AT-0046c]